jgi:hypothetical protein
LKARSSHQVVPVVGRKDAVRCGSSTLALTRPSSSLDSRRNDASSAYAIGAVPSAVRATRFFDPKTAPAPPRPKLRCRSAVRQAKSTRFQPAGPTVRVEEPLKRAMRASVMAEAARGTRRPATVSKSSSSASTIRQAPSTSSRRTGRSARPSMTTWSKPARLSMLGKRPPALEWVTRP